MIVLLPIILFVLLSIPYLFLIPGGDGSAELKAAYDLFHGQYLTSTNIFHPPVKAALFAAFFQLFGVWSYGFIGLILGSIGIFALFTIAKRLFDTKTASLSSCFLAFSGLYVVTAQPGMIDFIMTVLILLAFMFYLKQQYWWYSLVIAIAVLTKETAIIFVFSVIIVEFLQKTKKALPLVLPLLTITGWLLFLGFTGRHLWNAYNFSETKAHGSMYTIIYNIVTLHFINRFAYENWMHLLVFNFSWVFSLIAIVGCASIPYQKEKKAFQVIGIFSGLFFVMVLGFQTWAINRYVLPLLPFLYMFAAYGATRLRYHTLWITILVAASLISLSYSIDPISNIFWPKQTVLNETFYLNEKIDGGDGLTYNLQYSAIIKKRSQLIEDGNCQVPRLVSYQKQALKILQVKTCR